MCLAGLTQKEKVKDSSSIFQHLVNRFTVVKVNQIHFVPL